MLDSLDGEELELLLLTLDELELLLLTELEELLELGLEAELADVKKPAEPDEG